MRPPWWLRAARRLLDPAVRRQLIDMALAERAARQAAERCEIEADRLRGELLAAEARLSRHRPTFHREI